jgi:hypothetical protein
MFLENQGISMVMNTVLTWLMNLRVEEDIDRGIQADTRTRRYHRRITCCIVHKRPIYRHRPSGGIDGNQVGSESDLENQTNQRQVDEDNGRFTIQLVFTAFVAEVGLNSGVRCVYPMAIPKLTDRTKTMAQTMILALARMLAMAACVLKASLSITSEVEGLNLGNDIDSDGPLKVRCME